LTQASKVLRLAHPTLCGQIRQLEDSLGEKLFDRTGRRLVLTALKVSISKTAIEGNFGIQTEKGIFPREFKYLIPQ